MDALRSLSMSPSIAARAQKIRERMMIEQLSGVSPSNKDIFLSFCQRYEQQSVDARTSVCSEADRTQDSIEYQWMHQSWEDDWKNWNDGWTDWFKINRVIDMNTQVL